MFYNFQTIWQFILLALALLIFAGVSWKWPRAGAWLVIFLAPLYLLKIGNWPMTILEALIWVFVGVWVVRRIKTGNKSLPTSLFEREERRSGFFWPVVLILSGVIISTIFSSDPKIGLGILKSWFLAPIIFAFVLDDVFEGSGFKEIFSALFASAAAVAAISFVYLIFGRLTFDGRLAAFYLSPNHLAMWLSPGIVAGMGLWFCAKNNWQKFFLFLVSCFLFLVLYFTYSYGAWIGLVVAVIFILFYPWRLKLINQRYLFHISCFIFFVFALVFFLQLYGSHGEKLMSLLSSPRSSWQSRLMVWQAAIKILKDHWLIGIGPGLFQPYYLDYQQYFSVPYLEWAVPQPHNLFLAWWLQAGLLGLAGFIWLLVNFFRRIFNFLAETKPSFVPGGTTEGRSPAAIILAAVMVYFLVHGLADTTFWKNDLALLFWAIAFLGHRAGRRVC